VSKLHRVTLAEDIEDVLSQGVGKALFLHFGIQLLLRKPLSGGLEFELQECGEVFSELREGSRVWVFFQFAEQGFYCLGGGFFSLELLFFGRGAHFRKCELGEHSQEAQGDGEGEEQPIEGFVYQRGERGAEEGLMADGEGFLLRRGGGGVRGRYMGGGIFAGVGEDNKGEGVGLRGGHRCCFRVKIIEFCCGDGEGSGFFGDSDVVDGSASDEFVVQNLRMGLNGWREGFEGIWELQLEGRQVFNISVSLEDQVYFNGLAGHEGGLRYFEFQLPLSDGEVFGRRGEGEDFKGEGIAFAASFAHFEQASNSEVRHCRLNRIIS